MAAPARPQLRWIPQVGGQYLLVRCPFREAILTGTRGAAKTDALLMDYAQHVGAGLGEAWRGILFRRTYKQLDDIVARTRRWFSRIFPRARFNESDYEWHFQNGEALLLRYFDKPRDYWNYHGHEYPWIGWEELTNWPTLDGYHAMKSCNRSSVMGVPLKYRANTNPWGVGHNAVKAYIVDPAPAGTPIRGAAVKVVDDTGTTIEVEGWTRVRIRAHWRDNTALLRADPSYTQTIRESIAGDAQKEAAWLEEDWDVVAGGFFDDVWRREIHAVRPFAIPISWRIDRSFDWGSAKPFSVGWWAESDGTAAILADGSVRHFPRGTLFRIAELYGWVVDKDGKGQPNVGCRMTDPDIAKAIILKQKAMGIHERVRPGPADASIFDEVNGQSPAKLQEAQGVKWERADKSPGSRVRRWKVLRARLKAALDRSREEPGIYAFDHCVQFLRTVPVAPRDEDKPDDIDSDYEDHVLDETGYRVLAPKREWSVSKLPS